MEIDNCAQSIVILSSGAFADNKILDRHKEKIEQFMQENITDGSKITIGNIKNTKMIEYLESIGYSIIKKSQHVKSLGNSNRKLINESDLALFISYENSPNIANFINHANKIENKKFKVLMLSDKDI